MKQQYMHFAVVCKAIRIAKGISRLEMAKALNTSVLAIVKFENAQAIPISKKAKIIADMGGISLSELWGTTCVDDWAEI